MFRLKENRANSSVINLLPEIQYDSVNNCYEMESTVYPYMDILRIRTKDRTGMEHEEIKFENNSWQRFYLMYSVDVKIIALNFPVDTSGQTAYYQRQIRKTKNTVYRKWLEKEMAVYRNISVYKTNREFFLMIFAESIKQLNENLAVIDQTLGTGPQGSTAYLSVREKTVLLHILNNKCSMIRRGK